MTYEDFLLPEKIRTEYEYTIAYRYLDKYMSSDLFTEKQEIASEGGGGTAERKIWQYWDQGEEDVPRIVSRCMRSVRELCDSHEIIIINKNNFHEYVKIPDYIGEKYTRGIISRTHFSDILRLELLSSYGGIWIDATVFVSDRIPDIMMTAPLFMFRNTVVEESVLPASSWWICADKGNRLIHLMKKLLYRYWENENEQLNYYLLHIIMRKIIDNDYACQFMFNEMPYVNNSNPHAFWSRMNEIYDEDKWKNIRMVSPIHKLSYKTRFILGDQNTFYQAFVTGMLES